MDRRQFALETLRRPAGPSLAPLTTVDAAVRARKPSVPLHCLRPQTLVHTAAEFIATFPGKVLYAVKCNPDPAVLAGLAAGGVTHWDAASIGEIRQVRQAFPDAGIHFMHPVKTRPAIAEAWNRHGVRDFVVDSADELDKILSVLPHSRDLGLVVRMAPPKSGAVHDLSTKFGAEPTVAAALLRRCRRHAARLGLSFHVGSQCVDPGAWSRALRLARQAIAASGVPVEIVDVGGGFPVAYPGVTPPPLGAFITAVAAEAPEGVELWCEPGRALVAAAQSVVVQVLARRGDRLFINDGIYGSLSDAGIYRFRYPCRLIRSGHRRAAAAEREFSFFGPTCDSADSMEGPFLIPGDVREGDWIELGQLGAYGAALRTGFNGMAETVAVHVSDLSLLAERPDAGCRAA